MRGTLRSNVVQLECTRGDGTDSALGFGRQRISAFAMVTKWGWSRSLKRTSRRNVRRDASNQQTSYIRKDC